MDGVPSSKASVMALLVPVQPLAFVGSQASSRPTNSPANPAINLLHCSQHKAALNSYNDLATDTRTASTPNTNTNLDKWPGDT